jgi:LysM repeat protein
VEAPSSTEVAVPIIPESAIPIPEEATTSASEYPPFELPPVPPKDVEEVYEVKPGDTLYSIAESQSVNAEAILQVPFNSYLTNRDPKGDLIFPGDIIYIPTPKVDSDSPNR